MTKASRQAVAAGGASGESNPALRYHAEKMQAAHGYENRQRANHGLPSIEEDEAESERTGVQIFRDKPWLNKPDLNPNLSNLSNLTNLTNLTNLKT
jgi:hypothetical protein